MATETISSAPRKTTLRRAENSPLSEVLTAELVYELRKRLELPIENSARRHGRTLARRVWTFVEGIDDWLGGPPLTQRERGRRDVAESLVRFSLRSMVV